MKPHYLITISFAALWLLMACAHPVKTPDWDTFVDQFIEGYFKLYPNIAVNAGRHEYDGQLPDFSTEGLARQVAWFKDQGERVAAFTQHQLTDSQQFEREYLLAIIDGKLFWLEGKHQWFYKNPYLYVAFYFMGDLSPIDPTVYITREYAPLPERMAAFTRFASNIRSLTEQIRANIRPPIPAPFLLASRLTYGGLADFLEKDAPAAFASVDDETLHKSFDQANADAVAALREFDAWLEEQETEVTNEYALGPELYREMLWACERVGIPLDRLEEIAWADLKRNRQALEESCSQLAPGKTIPECVAVVMNDKPADDPVSEARRQLSQLKAFVLDHDLVSIPSGDEEAQVEETPSFMREYSAMILIPGPYEKGMPSFYYISPPDPAWSEEEQLAYIPGKSDLLFTSVHEVWPGHFLQFLKSNRSKSEIGKNIGSYAFSEGWAHYTEEMMWVAGLGNGDPAVHIGELLNALLRDVRFLSSIGLHTKGMTIDESEKMFQELAYQDPGNARQQAVRGTLDPLYLNYTLGKLMILKLREDWMAAKGDKGTLKAFHDQFLSYGMPPIPLVRKAMLVEDSGPAL